MADALPPPTPTPPLRTPPPTRPAPSHLDLARDAVWLGLLGFGGGMSVLGLIGHVAVTRRRWLTEREFANTATLAQMLPGGSAASALAHVGLRLRGLSGAAVAYTGFIVPGAVLTTALAAVYVRYGFTANVSVVLSGMNAAVVGIVAALALRMVHTAVGRLWQMGVAAGALLLSLGGGAGSGEVALLGIGAGLVLDLPFKRARLARIRRRGPGPTVALPDEGQPLGPWHAEEDEGREPPRPVAAVLPTWFAVPVGVGGLVALSLLTFRTGLGAYGGGFAVVPTLHTSAVGGGWIREADFSAAVAAGKLTPGPVLLMATFIGYVVRGLPGAAVATFSIFAGPFALVVLLGGWLLRMRSRRVVRAGLRGLTPAVVGLMAAAAVTLGSTLSSPIDYGIAAATLLTLARFEVNPTLLLALAGVARFALGFAGV